METVDKSKLPLLLLDNASMARVMNKGTFFCSQMPFEQAKMIVEKYNDDEIIRCFTGSDYKEICSMRENFLKNISGGTAPAVEKSYAAPKTSVPENQPQTADILPKTDDTNELLRQILAETKKTNELLTKLLYK